MKHQFKPRTTDRSRRARPAPPSAPPPALELGRKRKAASGLVSAETPASGLDET